MVVATVREEQAIRQMTDQLVRDFADTHSVEQVERAVGVARQQFGGHPVRQFVPILVERVARRRLAGKKDSAVGSVVGSPATSASPNATTEASDAVVPEQAPQPDSTPAPVVGDHTGSSHAAGPAGAHGSIDADASEGVVDSADPAVPSHSTGVTNGARTSTTATKPGLGKHASDDDSGGVLAALGAAWSANRRLVSTGLIVALVLVVVAVGFTVRKPAAEAPTAAPAQALTVVHGVVGSEKMAFFQDPKVVDTLARNGLQVDVQPAGSRQIATSTDLDRYDFAFPSSEITAEQIQRQRKVNTRYIPFSSPMAIATFAPIVDVLTRAGVVGPGPTPTLDVGAYLKLVGNNTRWDQLPGNTAYPVGKNILISTTDPRSSNSAALYLAAASYVANNETIVQGTPAEQDVIPTLSRLFVGQGYTENSSEGPFGNYLAGGMGPTPLAWIYESQFVEAAAQGKTTPEMRLLYPGPTVWSRHTLIPLGDSGDRLGQLLSEDKGLQRLAAEHGFRTGDPAQFGAVVAEHGVPVAADLLDVVAPPTYETLEHLIDGVTKSYN
ncbi:three-helix bundle dimerization domain-containing protein [Nocardia callitridis]|uniref:three-helix bundle dimerization domain-containing protein n=1 Tax=Nocardia callitridis TaxID=648753 RepID=UPI0031EBE2B6